MLLHLGPPFEELTAAVFCGGSNYVFPSEHLLLLDEDTKSWEIVFFYNFSIKSGIGEYFTIISHINNKKPFDHSFILHAFILFYHTYRALEVSALFITLQTAQLPHQIIR